jgi:hypothetical protein
MRAGFDRALARANPDVQGEISEISEPDACNE